MKKTFMLLFLVVVLTACAGTNTIYPTQKEIPTATQQMGSSQSSGTNYESDLEKVKNDTMAANDIVQDLFVPMNFKTGVPGDVVTFGVVFNSVNSRQGTFSAKISFVGARDTNSNPIEVNKTLVEGWLRESQTADFVLADKGSYYIPVTFFIGNEIKPGIKTVSGNYQYEIQIYKKSQYTEDAVVGLTKELYLRVE